MKVIYHSFFLQHQQTYNSNFFNYSSAILCRTKIAIPLELTDFPTGRITVSAVHADCQAHFSEVTLISIFARTTPKVINFSDFSFHHFTSFYNAKIFNKKSCFCFGRWGVSRNNQGACHLLK